MTYFLPPLCSERQPGIDYDCVWCSGVMLGNAVMGAAHIPSTLAEADALRAASGDAANTGSSIPDLMSGMKQRYGWNGSTPVYSQADFLNMLAKPGAAAAVIGRPLATGEKSPFRVYNGLFSGLHCVFLANIGNGYWLIDPEGPKDGTYKGQYVTLSDIKLFYEGGGALMDTIGRLKPEEASVTSHLSITDEALVSISIPAGTNVFDLDGKNVGNTGAAYTRLAMHVVTIGGYPHYVVRLPGGAGAGPQVMLVRKGQVTMLEPVSALTASQLAAQIEATAGPLRVKIVKAKADLA